jgi:hypothetical protein
MGSRTAQTRPMIASNSAIAEGTCIYCVLAEGSYPVRRAYSTIQLRHLSKRHTLKASLNSLKKPELKQIGAGSI